MADELELAFDFCKDDLVTEEKWMQRIKRLSAVENIGTENMLRQEADKWLCIEN